VGEEIVHVDNISAAGICASLVRGDDLKLAPLRFRGNDDKKISRELCIRWRLRRDDGSFVRASRTRGAALTKTNISFTKIRKLTASEYLRGVTAIMEKRIVRGYIHIR
jgi:hypothetical protein